MNSKQHLTLKKKVVKGGKALMLRHGLSFAINFLGGLGMARLFGSEVLGYYFAAFALFSSLRGIVDFGLKNLAIRSAPSELKSFVSVAFFFQLLLAASVVLISFVLIAPAFSHWFGKGEAGFLALGAGLGAAFYTFQSLPIGIMERNFRYGPVGIVEISDVLIFNLTALVLGFFISPFLALAAALAARGAVPALIAWVNSGIRVQPRWNGARFQKVFQMAYPLVLTEGIVWVISMAPGLIVVKLASPNAYGVSQMAMSLLAFTLVLPTILQRLSVSWFSKIRDHREELRGQMETIERLIAVFYAPAILFFAALSPLWVPALYGPKWPTLPLVLFWAALPTLFTAALMPFSSAFISAGKTRVVMLQNAVHALLFIAMLLILSPHYGIYALPLAQLVAHLAGLVYLIAFHRYFGNFLQADAIFFVILFVFCALAAHTLVKNGHLVFGMAIMLSSFLAAFMLNKKNVLLLKKLIHRLRHG